MENIINQKIAFALRKCESRFLCKEERELWNQRLELLLEWRRVACPEYQTNG